MRRVFVSPGRISAGIISDGLKEKLMDEILHLSEVETAPLLCPLQHNVPDLLLFQLAQHFTDKALSPKFVVGVFQCFSQSRFIYSENQCTFSYSIEGA